MAVRRINYTNRKSISRKDFKIYVYPSENESPTFDISINLQTYDLPHTAPVFVEAYRQTSYMRFDLGTVGNIKIPANRKLLEFDAPEIIRFRIKVTSVSSPKGVLLADADEIRPQFPEEEAEDRFSLLPVKSDEDLRDQISKLDFSDRPLLLISSGVGDWRSVARDPVFISLVYPSALREILIRILHIEEHYDIELMSDWRSQWLYFASRLPGVSHLPEDPYPDTLDDWIDEVVSAYCRKFNIQERFMNYWVSEGQV